MNDLHVLLVEDEPVLLRSLKNDLMSWKKDGVFIQAAGDSQEALAYAADKPVDVLITDIEMPGESGISLAYKLHETQPQMQLIFISAYSYMEYARAAISLKSIDYVLKPIDRYSLYEALEKAVSAYNESMVERVRHNIFCRHIDVFQTRFIEDLLLNRSNTNERLDAIGLEDIGDLWGAIHAAPCKEDMLNVISRRVLSSMSALKCTYLCTVTATPGEATCVFALKSIINNLQFDLLCDQFRMLLQIEGNAGITVMRSRLASSLLDLNGFVLKHPEVITYTEQCGDSVEKIAEKVETIIRKNYADKTLSVNAIAKEIHYSSSYLCTLYKRSKAYTINDFMNLYRIARVKELIRAHSFTFAVIARMTGYDNEAYMTRVFKKLEGIPPSVYRQRLRMGNRD